jgi:hypothetical protein
MFLRNHNTLRCLLLVFGIAVAVRSAAEGQPIGLAGLQRIAPQRDAAKGEWLLVNDKLVSSDELLIVEARWGAFDGWVDITEKLRDKVKKGRLFIPDLNVILAGVKDPKFGHEKALVVVYQYRRKMRMAIVASTAPTGRGGTLMLPEQDTLTDEDARAFHKTLVGTKWRIARNDLTIFFEDGKYGVSDWGDRRGIWMVTGPNRIGGVAYEGSHNDAVFDRSLDTGTLIMNGRRYSKLIRLLARGGNPVIEPHADLSTEPLFECVFGVYGQAIRGKRHPFVNLRPPNRNLWTKHIEDKLKGTLSYGEVDYIGTAKLVIPETGTYTIDIPESGTQFRLNGHLVDAGDLQLRKGVYNAEIYTNHWGQPYLKFAHAAVFKKATKARIPFVNTGNALEKFLSQKILDRTVSEVCSYQTKRINATRGVE